MEDRDLIALTHGPIDTAAAIAHVGDPSCGAITVFLGTTRADTDAAGRRTVALDYEAYDRMAIEQMRDLADQARRRWPIARVALVHRVGRVPLGEVSVAVAVSCPHRGEAFDACRWLIDELKKIVPIWKQEVSSQ